MQIHLFMLFVLAAPVLGEEAGAGAQARAAVQRSLPYLEKISTAWMREKKCNSCHTVTFLLWTYNEAAAHGLQVDRQKLEDWTNWSLADALGDHYWFRLRPRAMEALKAGGIPDSLLAKLKPVAAKTYTKESDYVGALEKALGAEDLERHREILMRVATLPNNGGGPDTLAQLMLGRAAKTEDAATTKSYKAIGSLLLEWQEPDGSWMTQGQLPEIKWGEKEMNEATTLWGILATSSVNSPDEKLTQCRQRALESLRNASPGGSVQSLALHALVAHLLGDQAKADALLKKLVGRQNADGGWGWLEDNKTSEAFSTGQVLYALGRLGHTMTDPVVMRAWEFLLRTQGADGGWDVPQQAVNRRPRKLNVYPYWGSAWAAIGLLQTLPDVAVKR